MVKYKRSFLLLLIVLVPILVLAGLFANLASANAPAATITVDTTDDELNSDGDCSLREAIQAANTDSAVDNCTAGSGADTVVVPAGTYTLTISGANENSNATGDLDILDELILQGAGALSTTIDGGALDRVLHVQGVTVTVEDLTVANGYLISFNELLGAGGGMLNQGGALTVQDCVVHDNFATSGGGLSNTAVSGSTTTLMVAHSEIISNTTNGVGSNGNWELGGGGIYNRANALNAQAVLTISHSLVASNQAIGLNHYREAMGGGVSALANDCTNCQVNTTVLHSTIRGNTAVIAGGISSGELVTNNGTSELWIEGSTISGNTTSGSGFGMGTGGGVGSNGMTTILNSTISGNQALGTGDPTAGKGGGIAIWSNSSGQGILTLQNATVTENEAVAGGGGIHGYPTGGLNPELTLWNNVVSNNSAPISANCLNEGGTFTSQGYNLEDLNTCSFDMPTDLVDTDPLLGPLGDNGGPTWTHALLAGSPAIDRIPTGSNGCDTTLVEDQRGVYRPQDGDGDGQARCDSGAFEYEPSVPLSSVTIEGPANGGIGLSHTFVATVDPISATLPITYTWQAVGQEPIIHTGGISDSVAYTWELSGTYQITVTASNIFATVTDTHSIVISEVPITGLMATNSSPTMLGNPTAFTATVTAGTHISYTWDFGDGSFGASENVTHIYTETGTYTGTVTASNPVSMVTATTTVTIIEPQFDLYLPLILRVEDD